MSDLDSINREQRLYVIKCGEGFTCLGFDVCEKWGGQVAKWLYETAPGNMASDALKAWAATKPETESRYEAYQALMNVGAKVSGATGKRCNAHLIPAFVGHEGERVEVTYKDGTKRRFYIGKSTGWLPCHLEIGTRRSRGGAAIYLPEDATWRWVGGKL